MGASCEDLLLLLFIIIIYFNIVAATKGEAEPERKETRTKVDEDRKHEYPFIILTVKFYATFKDSVQIDYSLTLNHIMVNFNKKASESTVQDRKRKRCWESAFSLLLTIFSTFMYLGIKLILLLFHRHLNCSL